MLAPYLPAILVPIVGLILPIITMILLFLYIEKESVEINLLNAFFLPILKIKGMNLNQNKNHK